MSFLKLDDYTLPGYDLKVNLSLKLKDEDASGESSGTSVAKKGNKGKKLEVKFFIKYSDEASLNELMRIVEATAKGDNKVYTITNPTANAAGMRRCRFTGDFKVDEQATVKAWLICFSLQEQISVPEMAEAREEKKKIETASGGKKGTSIITETINYVKTEAKEAKEAIKDGIVSTGKNVWAWVEKGAETIVAENAKRQGTTVASGTASNETDKKA